MPPVFFLALSKANASFLLITKKKILLARPSASQLLFYGKQYWYIAENVEVPSVTITSSSSGTKVTTSTSAASAAASGGSASPSSLHPSSHRRKKPKRRSTGVVNLDVDVSSLLSNLLWPLLPPLLWLCARPYSALLAQLQLGSQYHQTR